MHNRQTSELYIHIWPFKLFARGKEALQTVRWPVRFMLLGITACLLAIALWYGSKAYSLYIINTADKVVRGGLGNLNRAISGVSA
jgi:hypothetical protein